jgi:TonB family protein
MMATAAQHLLGQLVDGRFPLRKLLGVSSNSAVFLTDLPGSRPSEPAPEAAIKLIPEDPHSSDRQLERWRAAAALSDPGLLRILHFGRAAVDGSPCLYLVMELASENLGELLLLRALSPEEATGMMTPVLATLDFLHEKGLVHGGLKPANILAIRDTIKLAPDRILPAGEAPCWPLAAPYAAPESVRFPASDLWALGVTLYEALTQYLPKRSSSGQYVLPQLAAPFSEIIRGALVEDATERISLDQVRSLLDPAFVPMPKPAPIEAPEPALRAPVSAEPPLAAAAQASAGAAAPSRAPLPSVDPLTVPLSPVPPNPPAAPSRIPVSSLPNVNVTIAAPRRAGAPPPSRGSFKFFIIGAAATLLLALAVVPRLLRNSGGSAASESPSAASRPAPRSTTAPAGSSLPNPAPAKPPLAASPAPSRTPDATTAAPRTRDGASAPSSTASRPAPSAAEPGSNDPATKEVVHRVLPEVSQKARDTIRGTVRVNVRVELDPSGRVTSADLATPASSPFFANLALKAARQWQFAPSGASTAAVRFDFTNTATTAAVLP